MAIIDSYAEANYDGMVSITIAHPSSGLSWSAIGQCFTGDGAKLSMVAFYLYRYGSPAGGLTARLYALTGTFGTNGKPTGSVLASTNEIATNGIPTGDPALFHFVFATPYTLVSGTKYCIALEASSGSGWTSSNYIAVCRDSSSPSHAGNYFYYSSSAWTGSDTNDIIFYAYKLEQIYYFNAYTTAVWTNPNNMVDGRLTTFGSTTTKNATQVLTANDCPGTDLGTIIKTEIRCYGYGDGDDKITLNGTALLMPGSPGWSSYVDVGITTWAEVVALDATVQYTAVSKSNTIYCAKVEIRVTYTIAGAYIPRHSGTVGVLMI